MRTVDKGKGANIPTPKKKSAPSMRPKGIVIGAHIAPVTFIVEEEDDIITPLVDMPGGELSEEE